MPSEAQSAYVVSWLLETNLHKVRLRLKQVSEQPVWQYAKGIPNLASALDMPRLTERTVPCSGHKCFLLRTLSAHPVVGPNVFYSPGCG